MTFLSEERQNIIVDLINEQGKVLATELAAFFAVTPETIRRDLHRLEQKRKLKRVHGGAIGIFSSIESEPHFEHKRNIMLHAKTAIGKKAAGMIDDGDTIVIDVGTTTLQLAKEIQGVRNVTIVTNSIAAANVLNDRLEKKLFEGKVIVLGGILNPDQKSLSGSITCRMLEDFCFDKAFISCGGIMQPDISDYDMEESLASSIMIKQAEKAYLLVDSSKAGRRSFCRICDISQIDCVISDCGMPSGWKKDTKVQQLEWIVAEGV